MQMKLKRLLSLVLVVFMTVSLFNVSVFADETAAEVTSEVSSVTFTNVSETGGDNKISLSEARTFEVILPLGSDVTSDKAAEIASGASWTLSREKGMQEDTVRFPYQYLGGSLDSWTIWGSDEKFFSAIETAAVENEDGTYSLKLTLKNELFFGVNRVDSPRGNRNIILDYTGEYTLSCTSGDEILGSAAVRVNPYDDYRTNSELAAEIAAAKLYIDGRDDMYAEVLSLGTSTDGYDMPYIIISDSKATLEQYQEMKKIAESDPQSLIDQITAGTLEYKIPILYSNIHADETPGVDAPMNFIWDLAMSDTTDNSLTYKMLTGFTAEGEAQLKAEIEAEGIHWSELISDYATGLGFIKGENTNSGVVDLEKYYTVETVTTDVSDLLSNVFFIIVPEENVDGRTYNIRQNGNGFDLNRDNMFQTQTETQLMTKMISDWNPATFIELHGFVGGFQVEPCSPPHEPNIEYDLFAENAFKGGEAFGIAAVANNSEMNSYVMPLRDYLTTDEDGNPYWEYPWDDMSTNYTPQYSLLHGTVAYTIEVPKANQAATEALEYGLIGHAAYVAENKDTFFLNQLEGYLRGINNVDAAEIRDWYVDMNDNLGAEADVYRPVYEENNNFFPECYIIPVDVENQKNLAAAYEMEAFLIRNGVTVHKLTSDVTIGDTTYKSGSYVVSMYQAKRNVANGALYDGVLITAWTDLYSEPITAFSQTRGFDCAVITNKDAYTEIAANMAVVESTEKGATSLTGTADKDVVISNSGVSAIHAVNTLLSKGVKVGYITEGDYKGDFIVSYDDFLTIKDKYVLTATGVDSVDAASLITKRPTLYVPGWNGDFSNIDGVNYGVKNYPNYSNTNYNFDIFAYAYQMGFKLTQTPADADVIAGNRGLSGEALDEVLAGKPYLGAGSSAMSAVQKNILTDAGFVFDSNGGGYDALFFVTYESESMITDAYVSDGDNLMYGFGGGYFAEIPENAQILIKATEDTPLEGFFLQENLDKFLGSVQAITYSENGLDLTLFANSLTSKAHQQDDYRYAANTIFSKVLGDSYYAETSETEETPAEEPETTGMFTDVSEYAWYADAVEFVVANGYMSGISETVFAPMNGTTINELITFIAKAGNISEAAVKAMALLTKTIDKDTDLTAPLTREELCVILVKFVKVAKLEFTAVKEAYEFADSADISEAAAESVAICQTAGIVSGREDGSFDPKGIATRAEIAMIIYNFLGK